MDLTIIIATFGDPTWTVLANRTAVPSTMAQPDCRIIVEHGETLARARNAGAAKASTRWLVFLDADDTIDPGYAQAILDGTGDLRVPTLYEGGELNWGLNGREMEQVNRCPIGTGIERERFMDCGGFPEFRAWEDWALFLRAHRRGAVIGSASGAVYRAAVRPDSRNRTVRDARALHAEIRAWA